MAPGPAASLWSSTSLREWRAARGSIGAIVALVGVGKKAHLVDTDAWLRQELPAAILQRSPPHITNEDLARIMRWKLSRGKFRPRLQQMAESNSAELVEKCSSTAFRLLARGRDAADEAKLREAANALCELRGVGPATASLVLSVAQPAVPFMADEAMAAIPGVSVKYTLRGLLDFASQAQAKASQLRELARAAAEASDASDSEGDADEWSAADVSHALWAYATSRRLPAATTTAADAAAAGSPARTTKGKQPKAEASKRPSATKRSRKTAESTGAASSAGDDDASSPAPGKRRRLLR